MNANVVVSISQKLLEAILSHAKMLHPRETIFLLRGKRHENLIEICELVVPPLATYGRGFANIPTHMLPIDFSIIGTVHSHPSGNLVPSPVDLNNFWGSILMIVAFPYQNGKCVVIYNHKGEKLTLKIVGA
ncbi:MAG: Mov34/MPN/PAD-1 family protein [Candidatus Bathyarchaeia archaeon]